MTSSGINNTGEAEGLPLQDVIEDFKAARIMKNKQYINIEGTVS